jgi:uncharacterized protein DUF4386
MTRTTHARIAGLTLLVYVVAGITSKMQFDRATSGEGVAAKLAEVAAHASDAGVLVLFGLIQCFAAIVLAVTFYALTHDQDRDIAMFGMVCRVAEAVIVATAIPATLTLFWLATASGADAPDSRAARAIAGHLLRNDVALPATFFAVGSTAFSYLLMRGRMIPLQLAQFGFAASVLLVIALPLQLAGWLPGLLETIISLPMLAFEVSLGVWLFNKGIAEPAHAQTR